jgi:hypothetical protein
MRYMCAFVASFLCAGLLASAGLKGDSFLLVKISGCDREDSYKVLSKEDHKILLDLIKMEKLLHRKALTLARARWKENAETQDAPFPSGAVTTRRAKTVKAYDNEKEAKAKLLYYTDKIEREKAEDAKRDEEKLLQRHTRVSINMERRDIKRVKVDKSGIAEDKAREATKAERYAMAQVVYTECLRALIDEKLAKDDK